MDRKAQQYNLYVRIARKSAITLPHESDRMIASKWIQKINNTKEAGARSIQYHAMKLLLICLQRKRLVGPFKDVPKEGKALSKYDWKIQPVDIARLICELELQKNEKPAVSIDVAGNLCEFVAHQDIPLFGSQFYYAFSPETITKWDNYENSLLPRGLLNRSILSSPDGSELEQSVREGVTKKKAGVLKKIAEEKKKDPEFLDTSILKPSGAMKEKFIAEVPTAANLNIGFLGTAIDAGIVGKGELITGDDQIIMPHKESVAVQQGRKRWATEKSKGGNVPRGLQKAGRPNDVIPEDDQTCVPSKKPPVKKPRKRWAFMEKPKRVKVEPIIGGVDHWIETPAEYEARRKTELARQKADLLVQMPEKLRKRLEKTYTRPREEKEKPGSKAEPKQKKKREVEYGGPLPPSKFQFGSPIGQDRQYSPCEFGLTDKEQFMDLAEGLQFLHYVPNKQDEENLKKLEEEIEKGKILPDILPAEFMEDLVPPWERSARQRAMLMSPEKHVIPLEALPNENIEDVEPPWERSRESSSRSTDYYPEKRSSLLKQLEELKRMHPKKLPFVKQEEDAEMESEEKSFRKFINEEISVGGKEVSILDDDDILDETEMPCDDIFGEEHITLPFVDLPGAQQPTIIEDIEMPYDSAFGEEPTVIPCEYPSAAKQPSFPDEIKIPNEDVFGVEQIMLPCELPSASEDEMDMVSDDSYGEVLREVMPYDLPSEVEDENICGDDQSLTTDASQSFGKNVASELFSAIGSPTVRATQSPSGGISPVPLPQDDFCVEDMDEPSAENICEDEQSLTSDVSQSSGKNDSPMVGATQSPPEDIWSVPLPQEDSCVEDMDESSTDTTSSDNENYRAELKDIMAEGDRIEKKINELRQTFLDNIARYKAQVKKNEEC